MMEHFFICPYCWESISMLLDNSISYQSYIEVPIAIGSEVCCNPIQVIIKFGNTDLESFQAESIEQ